MQKLLKALIIFLIAAQFSSLNAQDQDRSDYSLLWKIEGNGLTKPSYLFGTMHVRNKKAFQFSDQVLKCLESADVFAAEVNMDSVIMNDLNGAMSREEDKVIFREIFEEQEEEQIEKMADQLGVDLNTFKDKNLKSIKKKLDELEDRNADLMKTNVDVYLYQYAKNVGLYTMGLETTQSHIMAFDTLSSEAKKEMIKDQLQNLDTLIEAKKIMLDLYSEGDIEAMWDFIQIMDPTSRQKLIDARNLTMLASFEPLMKDSSVFIAVGAAHLPGEKGIIKLLKQKGYTVTVVPPTFDHVDEITDDKIFYENWQLFEDEKMGYSVSVPHGIQTINALGGMLEMRMSYDLLQENVYAIYAFPMLNSTEQGKKDFLERVSQNFIKSQGQVLNSKQIKVNGNTAYEYSILHYSGFYSVLRFYFSQKYVYLLMYINSSNKKNTPQLTKFFDSFSYRETTDHFSADLSDWINFTDSIGAFSIKFPKQPNYMSKKIPNMEAEMDLHIYISINERLKEAYIVRWSDAPAGYYYPNDFEVAKDILIDIFSNSIDENDIDIKKMNGLAWYEPDTTFDSQGINARALVHARGGRIYVMLIQAANDVYSETIEGFLNSFSTLDYLPLELTECEIDHMQVRLPGIPAVTEESKPDDSYYYIYPYVNYATKVNAAPIGTEVQVTTYPAYFYTAHADTLFKNLKSDVEFFERQSYTSYDSGYHQEGDYWYNKGTISSPESSTLIDVGFFLKNNQLYRIVNYLPTELKDSGITNEVFESVKFKPYETSFDPFSSKTKLIAADLKSTDSVTASNALQAFEYYVFDEQDMDDLMEAYLYSYDDSVSNVSIKENIVQELAGLKHNKVDTFLLAQYGKDEGLKSMILNKLIIRDSTMVNRCLEMFLENPPLHDNSYILEKVTNEMLSTEDLVKSNFNQILATIDKDEYLAYAIVSAINSSFNRLQLEEEHQQKLRNRLFSLCKSELADIQTLHKDSLDYINTLNACTYLEGLLNLSSGTEDEIFEMAEQIGYTDFSKYILAYKLIHHKEYDSDKLSELIEDADNGWAFIYTLNNLKAIDLLPNKYKSTSTLALVALKDYLIYEYGLPDKIKNIGKEEIALEGTTYDFFIYEIEWEEEPGEKYLAISGGILIKNNQLDDSQMFADFYYKSFKTKAEREKLQAELIEFIKE